MNFIIFFNLFFIRLFHIHDSNHEFDRLTQVTQVFFFSFSNFFFNFIIQYWVNWELSFVIYFGLLSMKLSYLMTRVMSFADCFLCFFLIFVFQFYLQMLSWLKIEFHNLFRFAFYWVPDLMTWVVGLKG